MSKGSSVHQVSGAPVEGTHAKLRFCPSSPTLLVELSLSRTSLTVSMVVVLLDTVTVERLLITSYATELHSSGDMSRHGSSGAGPAEGGNSRKFACSGLRTRERTDQALPNRGEADSKTYIVLGRGLPVLELDGGARIAREVEREDERFRQLLLLQVVRPATGVALRRLFTSSVCMAAQESDGSTNFWQHQADDRVQVVADALPPKLSATEGDR